MAALESSQEGRDQLGAAAVILMEDAHHRGKAADEHSLDRLFEDAGFAYIQRLPVEVTEDQEETEAFIQRFLKRLKG